MKNPPRYCPALKLPDYRYIPGQGPKNESRKDFPHFKFEPLPPERWKENEPYLYGIDLYHQRYFYEAHEVWESLWHKVGIKTTQGKFLKALIQLAAAQLKITMREEPPARRLLTTCRKALEEIFQSSGNPLFMGLHLEKLLEFSPENPFEKIQGIRLELKRW